MTQTETVNRLAVAHLTCPYCGAEPGKVCKIVNFFSVPRTIPHAARRDPFIEAWSDGYITAESDSIQAHDV